MEGGGVLNLGKGTAGEGVGGWGVTVYDMTLIKNRLCEI